MAKSKKLSKKPQPVSIVSKGNKKGGIAKLNVKNTKNRILKEKLVTTKSSTLPEMAKSKKLSKNPQPVSIVSKENKKGGIAKLNVKNSENRILKEKLVTTKSNTSPEMAKTKKLSKNPQPVSIVSKENKKGGIAKLNVKNTGNRILKEKLVTTKSNTSPEMAKSKKLSKKPQPVSIVSKENKKGGIAKLNVKNTKNRILKEKLVTTKSNTSPVIATIGFTSKQIKNGNVKKQKQAPAKIAKVAEAPTPAETKVVSKTQSVIKTEKLKPQAKKETESADNVPDQEIWSLDNAPVFDEIIFRDALNPSKVKEHLAVFNKLIKEASQRSNIFADYKVMLDVTYFKIPNCPKRNVRLHLAHSFYNEEDDICMIVRDLKRGLKQDHEASKEKYESVLREAGITLIKTVLPYGQLRKEYGNYEMKMRLRNSYDAFLCDGSLIGPVVSFLGKKFKKSAPVPFRSTTGNLAREVEIALRKTFYMQGQKGPLISIPIGTEKTSTDHLSENIQNIIDQLKQLIPGGYENIRNMYLRVNIPSTKSVPIYISICRPPEKVPYVVGPREKLLESMETKDLHKFQIVRSGKIMDKSKAKVIGEIKSDRKQKLKNKKK